MSANSAIKRQSRIERRCIAPVVAALRAGQISARSADVFLRLSPTQQAVELGRRLKAVEDRERQSAITAQAIRGYLDTLGDRKVDLLELSGLLRAALQGAAGLP